MDLTACQGAMADMVASDETPNLPDGQSGLDAAPNSVVKPTQPSYIATYVTRLDPKICSARDGLKYYQSFIGAETSGVGFDSAAWLGSHLRHARFESDSGSYVTTNEQCKCNCGHTVFLRRPCGV